MEGKIDQGQRESEQQTCHRNDQSGDGLTAAFVKFGMPVICDSPISEKTAPNTLKGNPQQQQNDIQASIAKINPAVAKELVLGNWRGVAVPSFRGRSPADLAARTVQQIQAARQRFPFRRAGSERRRLCVGAAFGNPLPQLPAVAGPYSLPSVPTTLYIRAHCSSSSSPVAKPASRHTPRFDPATKSSKIFAVGLVKVFCASSVAALKFFPLRNSI